MGLFFWRKNKKEVKEINVTKDILIGDMLKQYPDSAVILQSIGMHCISCPSALGETLDIACRVHSMDSDEVVSYINEQLNMAANGARNK